MQDRPVSDTYTYAVMMKLADMQDLGSCAARRVGSSPTDRMKSGRVFPIWKHPLFIMPARMGRPGQT